MVPIEELRLENLLQYRGKLAKVVSLEANSIGIHYRIDKESVIAIVLDADDEELYELTITPDVIEAIGIAKMKDGYCLPKVNATRMLCQGEEGYYIGYSNTESPLDPIHATNEFSSFHYLQNAYFFIYGKEMSNFEDKIWIKCFNAK